MPRRNRRRIRGKRELFEQRRREDELNELERELRQERREQRTHDGGDVANDSATETDGDV